MTTSTPTWVTWTHKYLDGELKSNHNVSLCRRNILSGFLYSGDVRLFLSLRSPRPRPSTPPPSENTVLVQGPTHPQLSVWWVTQLWGGASGRRQLNSSKYTEIKRKGNIAIDRVICSCLVSSFHTSCFNYLTPFPNGNQRQCSGPTGPCTPGHCPPTVALASPLGFVRAVNAHHDSEWEV